MKHTAATTVAAGVLAFIVGISQAFVLPSPVLQQQQQQQRQRNVVMMKASSSSHTDRRTVLQQVRRNYRGDILRVLHSH